MIKYIVDGHEFDDENDVLEYVVVEDDVDDDEFDDFLNDNYGDIEICGYRYAAAYAFSRSRPDCISMRAL